MEADRKRLTFPGAMSERLCGRPRIIGLVAVCLLASACSSGQTSASAAATNAGALPGHPAAPASIADPCRLLSQEEVSAAIGAAVGPGELTYPRPKHPRCRFFTQSSEEFALDVDDPALFSSYAQLGTVPIAGIGDKALWQHDQNSSWLFIAKGGNLISVLLPHRIAAVTPAVQRAGQLIAGRM